MMLLKAPQRTTRAGAATGTKRAVRRLSRPLPMLACCTALSLLSAGSAAAASPAPGWTLSSQAVPSHFSSADNGRCLLQLNGKLQEPACDGYQAVARNAGAESAGCTKALFESELNAHASPVLCPADSPVTAVPVTVTDVLPRGLPVGRVEFAVTKHGEESLASLCKTVTAGEVSTVTCVFPTSLKGPIKPDQILRVSVYVTVPAKTPTSVTNAATVSGGGAPSVAVESTNAVGATPAPFGFASFGFGINGVDGLPDTQAGGHPYELSTTFALNTAMRTKSTGNEFGPDTSEDPRDIVVDLPLGFAASTLSAPECTLAQLSSERGCPPNTKVGEILTEPEGIVSIGGADRTNSGPIYNLVPEQGVPGEFGFLDAESGTHVIYAHVVPTPQGYVLQAASTEITEINFTRIAVTFFGDPTVKDGSGNAEVPYFTNPTDCSGGPLTATAMMDSWGHPGSYNADGTPNTSDPNWVVATSQSPPVTGCEGLGFDPSLLAQPTTSAADSPSGLEFGLTVPQPEDFPTTSTPSLKNATVTFPEGMTVDPSSGQGLEACSEAQIGWNGGTPENFNAAPPACPEASKIGSLELESPLIPHKLEGAIYLARQNENPFGSVFATYVIVDDPTTGVVLKIAGELKSSPGTGRLTAFFPENAQLPFSSLKLHFFGGPRAELATPESCGTFTTTSELEPWSAPDSPNAQPSSSFTINEGCVNGFNPTFTAGSTNLQAGAFTDFVASFSRADADQEMGGLSVTLPPGLLADIGSVSECSEAQIHEAETGVGGCPQSAQVGTVTAGAGPGPNPLFVTGKAYWTGPYKGAPFGLAVVVPAIAGPFNLGNVVVRQALYINPLTAQATDVSDPFPTFLHPVGANGQTAGVPIKLRRVDVDIDREGFSFNPTSCAKLAVTGSMASVQGVSRKLESPFQVTNCASLKFAPKFSVSTSGKTSKANGASLVAKVTEPSGPQGAQANLTKVKVELPLQLPSRLTTLQKACTGAQFEANPAACPEASKIGYAVVHTPLLPVPLQGPAIFVSHGGESFPSLTIVLQGDGVTIDLVGTTFISKAGITSTTYNAIPDSPFSSFELTLPEGRYSALAANGNLCALTKTTTVAKKVTVKGHGRTRTVTRKVTEQVAAALEMPNEMIGQNGAAIHQTTKIGVTGCPKAHKAKTGGKRSGKKGHKGKKK
jgi:hypothetical protein